MMSQSTPLSSILLHLSLFLMLFSPMQSLYAQPGSDCANAVQLTGFPFQQIGLTTNDTGDAYDESPCGNNYLKGNDYLFQYTPTGNEFISVELSNVGSWTGLHIFDNCPDAMPSCIASDLSSLPGTRIAEDIALTGGTTYYIVVSTFSPPQTTSFDIEVRLGTPPPTGSDCSDPRIIPELPYSDLGESTGNFGDNYSGSGPCVSDNYWNGDEVIYTYTPIINQRVDIEVSNLSGFFAGVHLLDGCIEDNPQCIDASINAVSTDNLLIEEVSLIANQTYFIVISTWENPQSIDYDLNIRLIDNCEAPDEFSARSIGNNSIEVQWLDSDEASFELELIEGINGSTMEIQSTENQSIQFSGLTPGEFYEVYLTKECLSPGIIITGVYDGPLSGGTPKGIELYTTREIQDLSLFGLGSANNGEGSDGQEYTFPAMSIPANTFFYWTSDLALFQQFFGVAADFEDPAALINGNDAVELFENGTVIDQFGDINVDGTGTSWEYRDGWAYRRNLQTPNLGSFDPSNWLFSGIDELEGGPDNASSDTPFPIGSFEKAPTLTSERVGPISVFNPPLAPACDGSFTDNGGASYDYFSDRQDTITICPDEVGYGVVVDFTTFFTSVENGQCLDQFLIFDGPNTSFPTISPSNGNSWCWDGNEGTETLAGQSISATDTSGCLTFFFSSNDSLQAAGWLADVQCVPLQICDDPTGIQVDTVNENSATISWVSTGFTLQTSEISYGIGMFNPDAGTILSTAGNTISLSNLSANETYTYFIRNTCGAFGESAWIGPFTFETNCTILPGNEMVDAIPVGTLPAVISGSTSECYTNTFGESGPEVFYQFTTDDCTYQVQISTCNANTNFDTYLYLIADNGTVLATNDDDLECSFDVNGQKRLSTLNFFVEPSTAYYVALEGFGSFAGSYQLDIIPNVIIPIEANEEIGGIDCYEGTNGFIFLDPSGGASPYTFEWSTGGTLQSIAGLSAGMYQVTVTDDCGLEITESFELSEPDSLEIEWTVTQPSTDVSNDGGIQVTVLNGLPPFQYQWENGSNTPFLNGLSAGEYCILITDANDCEKWFCFQLVGQITNTNDPEEVNQIQVFPSPAKSTVWIGSTTSLEGNAQIEVFDFAGKQLFQNTLQANGLLNQEIDIQTWANGIYLVKMTIDGKVYLQRFVKG